MKSGSQTGKFQSQSIAGIQTKSQPLGHTKKTSILSRITKHLGGVKSKPKIVEKDATVISPERKAYTLKFSKECLSPKNYRSQAHIPAFLPKG